MKKEIKGSPFASLIDCMKNDGLAAGAKRLDLLLRGKVACARESDFQGDFGLEMKSIKRTSWRRMSFKTKATFGSVAGMILKVWPAIGL
jgi:hypothetical protein